MIYVYYNYGGLDVTSAFLFKRKAVLVIIENSFIILIKADGFVHSTKEKASVYDEKHPSI